MTQPWKSGGDGDEMQIASVGQTDTILDKGNDAKKSDMDAKKRAEAEKLAAEENAKKLAEEQARKQAEELERKQAEERAKQLKEEQERKQKEEAGKLPVVAVTTTGTANPYNGVRLIDASSRKLTVAEVAQMSKEELALARNAIYARHGYQFKNPELKEFFSRQSWFKSNDVKIDAIPFTQIELDNIRIIKAQEQKQ